MHKLFKNPWFLIAALAVTLLAIIFFLMIPAIGDIKNLNQKIIGQRTLLESRYEKRLSIKTSIQNYNALRPQIPALLDAIYLTSGNEIEFITSMETLADKHNVQQTITFNDQTGEAVTQNKKKIPIEIFLNGNYANILMYLKNLEKLNFYLIIESVSLVPRINDTSGSVKMLLKGYTFWQTK